MSVERYQKHKSLPLEGKPLKNFVSNIICTNVKSNHLNLNNSYEMHHMNCRYRLRGHNLANASEAMYENAIKIFTSVGRERQYATLL